MVQHSQRTSYLTKFSSMEKPDLLQLEDDFIVQRQKLMKLNENFAWYAVLVQILHIDKEHVYIVSYIAKVYIIFYAAI